MAKSKPTVQESAIAFDATDELVEPIALVHDLHTEQLTGSSQAPRALGRMLANWLWEEGVRAAWDAEPARFVAVAGAATGVWARHEEDTDFRDRIAFLEPHLRPLIVAALSGDSKNEASDLSSRPLIDNELGRVWLRIFVDNDVDRIVSSLNAYITNLPLGVNSGVEERSQHLVSLLATVPADANYPEQAQELAKLNHEFRQQVAARLGPILNAYIREKMPHEEMGGKKKVAEFVNSEAERFGLAVKCPKTGLPAKLKTHPGSWPKIGRFFFEVYIDGKRKMPAYSDTLPELELIDATPSREAELGWQEKVGPRSDRSGRKRT